MLSALAEEVQCAWEVCGPDTGVLSTFNLGDTRLLELLSGLDDTIGRGCCPP